MNIDSHLLGRIERCALLGARNDPRSDKTDWIRIWAMARSAQGKPDGSGDWREAFGTRAPVDYDWSPNELIERHHE